MDKFLKRGRGPPSKLDEEPSSAPKQSRIEINLADLPLDPGLRSPIVSFHDSEHDRIRRYYLQKGPNSQKIIILLLLKAGNKIGVLIPLGLVLIQVGWSIVKLRMLHFVYLVTFSSKVIQVAVILLVVWVSIIGRSPIN